jgi:hypothetical protein
VSGYWNTINPKETKEIIANERDTFHSRAQADADLLNQGRFKKETAATVTGSAAPTYPAVPTGPWSSSYAAMARDALTDELGYQIDAVEPVLERPTPNAPEAALHLPATVEHGEGQGGERTPTALTTLSSRKSWRRF